MALPGQDALHGRPEPVREPARVESARRQEQQGEGAGARAQFGFPVSATGGAGRRTSRTSRPTITKNLSV